jgi:hypothetical protein
LQEVSVSTTIELMFDYEAMGELATGEVADALAASRDELMALEARQLVLAATWADHHAGDFVQEQLAVLPGMPRLVDVRGGGSGSVDGCPKIEEYAAAELAALLGCTTVVGEQLIADAVVLRHRHPLMWTALRAGQARVWLARKAARRCVQARLDRSQAGWVDAETTPYVTTLPPGRFMALVEAKIIEADPRAAQERARAKALAQFVHAGATDEHGLRTLVARANAGDVTYLVAVLDRIAVILAAGGHPGSLDERRAEALRILANPARALAMLTEATWEEHDPAVETPADLEHEAAFPHGDCGGVVDSRGRPLSGVADLADLPLLDDAALSDLVAGTSLGTTSLGDDGPREAAGSEEGLDPTLLRALLEALERFDATRLDPTTVFHVHVSRDALLAGKGVARVEGLGAMSLHEVRDWLLGVHGLDHLRHQIRVLPVLDAAAVTPVDRYEVPRAMSRLAGIRTPFEVFPYGTLDSRQADDDHCRPYRPHGPPGQTNIDNLAKLSRFHHRLKTNGGWALRTWTDGEYWWRTPHGHWFRVDATGTHHHGRDSSLDRRLQDERVA